MQQSPIYALERISRDSRRDYWTIMETLTAYVRERAPWPPWLPNPFVELQISKVIESDGESTPAEQPKDTKETRPQPATAAEAAIHALLGPLGDSIDAENKRTRIKQIRPATDIQAVLAVLGYRDDEARKQEAKRLDLAATDL